MSVTLGFSTKIFYFCKSLETVTLPKKLETLSSKAFAYCESLTSITVPASVTSIGNGCFQGDKNLKIINFEGTKAQWESITKGDNWNFSVGTDVVHCSDGNVVL